MPGISSDFVLAEPLADEIGCSLHDVEKLLLPESLFPGYGRFDHVTHAVELVGLVKVCPPVGGILYDEVGVDISVGLLSLSDGIYNFFGFCLQLRVRSYRKRVSDCFQPLGDVAVLEDHSVEFSL